MRSGYADVCSLPENEFPSQLFLRQFEKQKEGLDEWSDFSTVLRTQENNKAKQQNRMELKTINGASNALKLRIYFNFCILGIFWDMWFDQNFPSI